jgi:hypothetical protein
MFKGEDRRTAPNRMGLVNALAEVRQAEKKASVERSFMVFG